MRQVTNLRRARQAGVAIALMMFVAACAGRGDSLDPRAKAEPGTPQDFVVNAGDRVFFTTDSAELTPQAQATLTKQVQWLNKYQQYAIQIEGHADERGTREYNLALGARRATAARNFLVGKGVAAGRINTLSYGKERPVAVCDDISCWSQNRRAVTVVKAGAGG